MCDHHSLTWATSTVIIEFTKENQTIIKHKIQDHNYIGRLFNIFRHNYIYYVWDALIEYIQKAKQYQSEVNLKYIYSRK